MPILIELFILIFLLISHSLALPNNCEDSTYLTLKNAPIGDLEKADVHLYLKLDILCALEKSFIVENDSVVHAIPPSSLPTPGSASSVDDDCLFSSGQECKDASKQLRSSFGTGMTLSGLFCVLGFAAAVALESDAPYTSTPKVPQQTTSNEETSL